MYDKRVEEAVRRAASPLPRGRARRVAVAGDQARLHRPAARAPAARVRRDLLQLGRLPGAAPALLPQRLHLLAPGGRDRAPRGRGAELPLLLPAAATACGPRCATIAPSFDLQNRWENPQRDLRNVVRALRAHFPRPARAQPDLQIQVLCSLFFRNKAAYIIGRVDQRAPRAAVRRADPAERARRALPRHAARRARTSCWCCSRSRAPTSSSTWRCRRPTSRSCAG